MTVEGFAVLVFAVGASVGHLNGAYTTLLLVMTGSYDRLAVSTKAWKAGSSNHKSLHLNQIKEFDQSFGTVLPFTITINRVCWIWKTSMNKQSNQHRKAMITYWYRHEKYPGDNRKEATLVEIATNNPEHGSHMPLPHILWRPRTFSQYVEFNGELRMIISRTDCWYIAIVAVLSQARPF